MNLLYSGMIAQNVPGHNPRRSAQPATTRLVGILMLALAILVGWGAVGSSSGPAVAQASSPATAYPLYAWGDNGYGQLGNGTTTQSNTPVAVSLPAGVTPTQLAAGYYHSLAIGSDGKLYAWGANYLGQLGNGSANIYNLTPGTVSLPAGVRPTAITAGFYHSLAIGSDSKLYAWGYNYNGQLGDGSTTERNLPVVITPTAGVTVTAIAAGLYHNLAIGSDGKLYAWGKNDYGQLGNGSTAISTTTPVTVSLPAGVTPVAIGAGYNHSLAAGSDGKLYAWGKGDYGQLGNGSTIVSSTTPVVVNLPAGVTATSVVGGGNVSLAIGSDGKLYAWGSNGNGELGNTSAGYISSTPVVVSLPAGVTPINVAAGSSHVLAFGSDNKLYAWGWNSYGQLGNGTTTTSNVPLVIGTISGFTRPPLAAYGNHSQAPLIIPSQIAATSGSPQSATVGTGFAAPLVATVRDVANNPVSSVTVTFTAPSSGASGTFAGGSLLYTGTTDASGTVTATSFTANTVAGSYSVTASVGGVSTPATFNLTNNAGAPANVTAVSGDGQNATVATAFANPLVVSVTDQYNNPVSGTLVTFNRPATGASLAFAGGVNTATTGPDGQASSAAFSANTVAGNYSVAASVSGVSSPATFSLTNTAGVAAIVTAVSGGGQSTAVTTAFANPLVVSVTDQYNNPVSGTLVTFNPPVSGPSAAFSQNLTTATSGANGQATSAALSANTVAGSYTISATVSGVSLPANFALTNQPGTASNLSIISGDGQGTQVTNTFSDPLAVHVTDANGNAVGGISILFAAPASGASGSFAQAGISVTVTTNENGDATAPAFTANTVAGDYAVSAAIVPNAVARAHGLSASSVSFALSNLPGFANTVAVMSGNNQSSTVNTAFSAPLVVSVTDQYGNPISGTTVTFAAPASGASAAFAGGVTGAVTGSNGQATSAALTANSVAGSYLVTASVQGRNVIVSSNFSLTNTAGAAVNVTAISGGGQSTAVTTFFANSLVVSVTDQYNNPVSGTLVTFNPPATGASAAFQQGVVTATSGANGQATSARLIATSVAGSYTVSATVSGVITPATFSLTNTPGPASTLVLVSGDNQQAVISTTFGSPLVAKVTDNQGNAVSGAEVDFAAPASGASATFGGSTIYTGTTDATGTLTTTLPKANAVVGSYTVTATLILSTRSGVRAGLVGPRATSVQYHLTNLAACNPLMVTSAGDDGSCGTLRQALVAASTNQTKTVTISLSAGSVISLTTGLTLTNGVTITTTAPCGVGAGNTMLPPITIRGVGANSGNGLTLAGHNQLYNLWVRGFSGVQIKAPAGSSTKMQCVKASKL